MNVWNWDFGTPSLKESIFPIYHQDLITPAQLHSWRLAILAPYGWNTSLPNVVSFRWKRSFYIAIHMHSLIGGPCVVPWSKISPMYYPVLTPLLNWHGPMLFRIFNEWIIKTGYRPPASRLIITSLCAQISTTSDIHTFFTFLVAVCVANQTAIRYEKTLRRFMATTDFKTTQQNSYCNYLDFQPNSTSTAHCTSHVDQL